MATSTRGCYQTLTRHHAASPVQVSEEASRRLLAFPRGETGRSVPGSLAADARPLHLALLYLSLPLADAARTFIRRREWGIFGYARLGDHARERLDRTARWVRDMAALGEAAERLPGLADALTGEDGGHPLGVQAAREIGRVATPESFPTWLSLARTLSVRALRAWTRRAAANGTCWPENICEGESPERISEQDMNRHIYLRMPSAAREAFNETFDLYRAVEGHAASTGAFIDSLVAEAASGSLSGEINADGTGPGLPHPCAGIPKGRCSPARTSDSALDLPDVFIRARIRRWLREFLGKDSDERASEARMRRLLVLHDSLERRLAEIVTGIADRGNKNLDDDARKVLGWSHSTLSSRIRLVRRLRRLPVVRQAYREGRIGRMAAQTIAGMLLQQQPDGTIPLVVSVNRQRQWVERASVATCRRLQDETRAVTRLMALGQEASIPLDDVTWHASLHRQAGMARRRVQALTAMAQSQPAPLLTLRLSLNRDTAAGLRQALDAARRQPALRQTFSGPGRVPEWMAFLALLQEFCEVWDAGEKRTADKIYDRDGWRCLAPGCTSRKNLEAHHVVYRSRGGSNRQENLACLCRFHHQMGEHGLLSKVRGTAPLVLTWLLGKDGRGGRFRNDLRLNG